MSESAKFVQQGLPPRFVCKRHKIRKAGW